MNETIHRKIIIVGDSATGKTSIIERYINNKFSTNLATIVPHYYSKIIKSNENIFHINIWDLPGQDRTPILTLQFAKDTQGIIYCCDATNITTRNNLKIWEADLKSKENIENIPKIIVENKCDLLGEESNYNDDINSLRLFSKELGCKNYFRTSAKLGYNIDDAVEFLINEIIKDFKENYLEDNQEQNNNKKLTNKNNKKNNNDKNNNIDKNNNKKERSNSKDLSDNDEISDISIKFQKPDETNIRMPKKEYEDIEKSLSKSFSLEIPEELNIEDESDLREFKDLMKEKNRQSKIHFSVTYYQKLNKSYKVYCNNNKNKNNKKSSPFKAKSKEKHFEFLRYKS